MANNKLGTTSLIAMLQCVNMAKEFAEDYMREVPPGTRGRNIVSAYVVKFVWVLKDLLTNPQMPEEVRNGIRAELVADPFTTSSFNEKYLKLPPESRELMETILDLLLKGEKMQVIKDNAA